MRHSILLAFAIISCAKAACKYNADCEVGYECERGQCKASQFIGIPGKCSDLNEEWRECADDCTPTCADPHPLCVQDCTKHSCQCKAGHVRDNGRCIPKEDCGRASIGSGSVPSDRRGSGASIGSGASGRPSIGGGVAPSDRRGSGTSIGSGASVFSDNIRGKFSGERCERSGECATGLSCVRGVCSRDHDDRRESISSRKGIRGDRCTTDSDCVVGFSCGHGFCAELDIPRNNPEPRRPVVASNGELGDRCDSDRDCNTRYECKHNMCSGKTFRKGTVGDRCVVDSDCASVYTCNQGTCNSFRDISRGGSAIGAGASSNTGLPAGAPLSQLLADFRLIRNDGSYIQPESLDQKFVALFFCAEWSFPCRDFLPTLTNFYDKITRAGEQFEIIYIAKDSKEDGYDKFTVDFGNWAMIPYNQVAKAEFLYKTFDVQGVPFIPLVRNGKTIVRDIRPEVFMTQKDNPIDLFHKWKSL